MWVDPAWQQCRGQNPGVSGRRPHLPELRPKAPGHRNQRGVAGSGGARTNRRWPLAPRHGVRKGSFQTQDLQPLSSKPWLSLPTSSCCMTEPEWPRRGESPVQEAEGPRSGHTLFRSEKELCPWMPLCPCVGGRGRERALVRVHTHTHTHPTTPRIPVRRPVARYQVSGVRDSPDKWGVGRHPVLSPDLIQGNIGFLA